MGAGNVAGVASIGIGDDILSSGIARVAQQTDPRKVRPMLERGFRWSGVWLNNPRIAQPGEVGDFNDIPVRVASLRPYMAGKTRQKWLWKEYVPPVGEIYFSDAELEFGARHAGLVIVEPHIKAGASPNKRWDWIRWNKLAYLLSAAGVRVTQLGPEGTRTLDRVDLIPTPSFRMAAAVLANARAAVLPEGALHHAAAALNVPAVVIFGGYISPRQTGYAGQASLFTGGEPCGMRVPCEHCAEAMAAITPKMVFDALRDVLGNSKQRIPHAI